MVKDYSPNDFGKKEVAMMLKYNLQLDDARTYFEACIKPRLDRSYKLYMADNSDRAQQIKGWQANVSVPYIHAVVETLKPRILDARPEFTAQGRKQADQPRAAKLQQLMDYGWEVAGMDRTSELLTHAAMVYGTGFLQVSWKKDVREQKFLSSDDLLAKKLTWEKRKQTFYDAPYCEWVDNYSLWYDWHNTDRESKQYWFKRLILTGAEIKRRYPMAEPKRLKMALNKPGGDLEDYGSIRARLKLTHEETTKGADYGQSSAGINYDRFQQTNDQDLKMYETFEWTRPFDDEYAVVVNDVPILKGGSTPILYDYKEASFIDIPYLRLPGEFEGYGIPLILENPQLMLNMVKNQRLDSATLNIHKMWVVNPLANIKKDELVTRPFGIIYSTDPNGVKEVQFTDVKASAYKEEELLKGDMRYASGVDDFSMGVGGGQGTSATEVRHLRESTLERVRLFVNHLGDGYARLMRYWMSMQRQFFSDDITIRIIGDDGKDEYPIIQEDDLMGEFDFKAAVLPSIAGQNDVKKKQDMDLFQLLITLPFIDPRKLTSKVLFDWNWDIESISKEEEEQQMPGMPGAEGQEPQIGPDGQPMQPGMEEPGMAPGGPADMIGGMKRSPKNISPQVADKVMAMLGKKAGANIPAMREMASPVNLLKSGAMPPTVKGVGGKGGGGANPRGLNRGGNVNTNIPLNKNSNPESALQNRAFSIQGKKN